MKILVFADSHGRSAGMFYAIENEKPDAVIHLGDYTGDADELERAYRAIPVYRVRGNNDYDPDIPLHKAQQYLLHHVLGITKFLRVQ